MIIKQELLEQMLSLDRDDIILHYNVEKNNTIRYFIETVDGDILWRSEWYDIDELPMEEHPDTGLIQNEFVVTRDPIKLYRYLVKEYPMAIYRFLKKERTKLGIIEAMGERHGLWY